MAATSPPASVSLLVPMPVASRTISADRPVGDALAVRQASATNDPGLVAQGVGELVDEAGLAHAGRAQDGEQMADALVPHLGERVVERPPLPFAADHRCVQPPLVARGGLVHRQQPEGLDRRLAALDRDVSQGLDLDRVADQALGLGGDQDLARLGGLLEARSHVHRVAGDHALARCPVPGDHLAGGDPGPPRRARHRRRRPGARASRISAAARTARRASSSWTRGMPNTAMAASPMNFSSTPPCALDDRPHRVERSGQQPAQGLRIELLTQGRGADQVTEQDRDRLAGLARGGRGCLQRCAASVAEARPGGFSAPQFGAGDGRGHARRPCAPATAASRRASVCSRTEQDHGAEERRRDGLPRHRDPQRPEEVTRLPAE